MPIEQLRTDLQLSSNRTNLILIERCERLYDAACVDQFLNPRDTIVMRLDQVGFGGALGFDGVGINRALAEDPFTVEVVLACENPLPHFDTLSAVAVTR